MPRECVEFGAEATHAGIKPVILADGIGTDMVVPHSVCNPRADCFGLSRTTCLPASQMLPSARN